MKSRFQFSKNERNGIFLLLVVIVVLQVVLWFKDESTEGVITQSEELQAWREEVDSLKLVKQIQSQPKLYPFNPNFITDYKGYTLGMSNEEIDRLHNFRANNQWVNSAAQFQKVTQVSDSLLSKISPYFKFPEWVSNPSKPKFENQVHWSKSNRPKTYNQKIDLNKATSYQLQEVYGVGEKLSERIIKYRNTFEGGFHSDIELTEIYGLSPEVIDRIMEDFTVKSPRSIVTFNLNEATRDQLVTIQYIDYEIANNIIEERTLMEGFNSIDELTKVEQFPVKKMEIIRLYLHL